jgi:hypothetical protein
MVQDGRQKEGVYLLKVEPNSNHVMLVRIFEDIEVYGFDGNGFAVEPIETDFCILLDGEIRVLGICHVFRILLELDANVMRFDEIFHHLFALIFHVLLELRSIVERLTARARSLHGVSLHT